MAEQKQVRSLVVSMEYAPLRIIIAEGSENNRIESVRCFLWQICHFTFILY